MSLAAMRDIALIVLGIEAMMVTLGMGMLLFVVARGLKKGKGELRRLLRRGAQVASIIEGRTTALAENRLSLAPPLAGLMFNLGRRAWPQLKRLQRGR